MKKSIFIIIALATFTVSAYAKTTTVLVKNITLSQSIKADSTEFKDYYGSYKMADNPMVERMKAYFKDGEFWGEATGYPPTKLTRKKDDEFEESSFGAVITFTRTGGIVTGIKIAVQGQELLGTKE
jgi:LPS O-antigen subunit length determinant protein (WzzB/FepE family)